MAESTDCTGKVTDKEQVARRSQRIRIPSKRMLMYSQDTDSDSSVKRLKRKFPGKKKISSETTQEGTLEHFNVQDEEPVAGPSTHPGMIQESSDDPGEEPESESEEETIQTKRPGRKRGSRIVKGRSYDDQCVISSFTNLGL